MSPSGYSAAVIVRIASSVERTVTNALAAVLRLTAALLTRLLGRGRHREWRRHKEAESRRGSDST
jgi:hypothetical protein